MLWRADPARRSYVALLLVAAVAALIVACGRRGGRPVAADIRPGAADVRVAIRLSLASLEVSATSPLSVVNGRDGALLGNSRAGAVWTLRAVDRDGIELSTPGARSIVVRAAPVLLRAGTRSVPDFIVVDGRRFRGTVAAWRSGDRLLLVNTLPVEQYLKGVVALEIGSRSAREAAAVAAQAVAARSFTYSRIGARRSDTARRYDLIADVSDQAYGGFDSEVASVTAQVTATEDLVLTYGGRVIEAVYSSSCGGTTAAANEVWQSGGQPYLQSVSDSIPGGRGYYCDIAPGFAWSVSFTRDRLVQTLNTYLKEYVRVSGEITAVQGIAPLPQTASGRVRGMHLVTNAGTYEVAGDRVRFVLRDSRGTILRSTRFTAVPVEESVGGVLRMEVHGTGYGHGVGMCQWGAIGRARAGQDYREILLTYYRGARIEKYGDSSPSSPNS